MTASKLSNTSVSGRVHERLRPRCDSSVEKQPSGEDPARRKDASFLRPLSSTRAFSAEGALANTKGVHHAPENPCARSKKSTNQSLRTKILCPRCIVNLVLIKEYHYSARCTTISTNKGSCVVELGGQNRWLWLDAIFQNRPHHLSIDLPQLLLGF